MDYAKEFHLAFVITQQICVYLVHANVWLAFVFCVRTLGVHWGVWLVHDHVLASARMSLHRADLFLAAQWTVLRMFVFCQCMQFDWLRQRCV